MTLKQPYIEYILVAILALAYGIWSNPSMMSQTVTDTQSYIRAAENLPQPHEERPPIYPLLILMTMTTGGAQWATHLTMLNHLVFPIFALLALDISRRLNLTLLSRILIVVGVIVIPGIYNAASVLIPEFHLAVGTMLVWWIAARIALAETEAMHPHDYIIGGVWLGLVSALMTLTKPVWIVGLFPVLLALVIIKWKVGLGVILRLVGSATVIYVVIFLSYQLSLILATGQGTPSSTSTMNLNLIVLRLGLVEYGEDTAFYDYLEENDLLATAQALEWDEFETFSGLKDQIPGEVRKDAAFYRTVLRQNPAPMVVHQLLRVPRFITTGPGSISAESFPLMPSFVRAIYVRVFPNMHKLLYLPLLGISVVMMLTAKRYRNIILLTGSIVLYYAFVLTFLTYQDPHFTRMRVACEPQILFAALMPIVALVEIIYPRLLERLPLTTERDTVATA
jgi:hypothetical protein